MNSEGIFSRSRRPRPVTLVLDEIQAQRVVGALTNKNDTELINYIIAKVDWSRSYNSKLPKSS